MALANLEIRYPKRSLLTLFNYKVQLLAVASSAPVNTNLVKSHFQPG
jgi:hypothetical protein